MIPVLGATEPATFDGQVRQPGLRYLSGQTGPTRATPPYWRRALPDLFEAYDGTCAYLGMRLNTATAFATADHFIPRASHPHLAYEWANLRLAAPTVNTFKGDKVVPVDPFLVAHGEFTLNLLTGDVEVGTTRRAALVGETIRVLRLNHDPFATERRRYIDDYLAGEITRAHLARWFPFGAAELTRQGH